MPQQNFVPENLESADPILRSIIPHPGEGKYIFSGKELEAAAITPNEILDDSALAGHITTLYTTTKGKVRMIEHLPAEKFLDLYQIHAWTKEQARSVGAASVFAYHPSPSTLGVDVKKLILNGVLRDFASAGGESAADGLNEQEREYAASMRELDALTAKTIQLKEDPADPIEHARLRAVALANSAAGNGWSGRKGKEMFEVLTDEEKYQAVLARIHDGSFMNLKHLEAMNPATWTKTGFPKYFGSYMPQPFEMGALKKAWDARMEDWRTSVATIGAIEQGVTRRSKVIAAGKSPGMSQVPQLSLEDLTTIQTSTLDDWAQNEPAKYDEWVRQFFRRADPITSEIADLPQSKARHELAAKLDTVKSAIADIEAGKIFEGPHPNGDPKDPYNRLTVGMLNARNSTRSIGMFLRTMSRPYVVLGPARQGDHPLDIQQDMDTGVYQRSIFQDIFQGDLKRHQGVMKAFQQFDQLFRAASHSEELDRKIARGLDIGIWRTPSELDKSEWQVPAVKIGLKAIKIDLADELPKLAAFYEDIINQAEKTVLYRINSEAGRYRADIKFMEHELRRRELGESLRTGGQEATWNEILPGVLEKIKESLRKGDKATKDATISYINGIPTFLGQIKYTKLKALQASVTHQLKKRLELKEAINDGSLRRENYRTRVHRMTADYIRSTLRDPYTSFGYYANAKVRNHFLDPVTSDKEPYKSWAVGWPMYVQAMMRTTHLEMGLIKATKRMRTLPVDQQAYASEWIRNLKGIDVPFDVQMNRMVMEGASREQHAVDAVIKSVFKADLAEMSKSAKASGLLNSRPWTKLLRFFAGWTMYSLIGVVKVGKLHASEVGYLIHELAKRPLPDIPLGVPWAAVGALKGGRDGARELGSFIKSNINSAPRWYSEPTYMGAVDSAHSLLQEMYEENLPTNEKFIKRTVQAVPDLWAFMMKATTYWVRATTYYTLKQRALHYGLSEEVACMTAAQQTNNQIGAFSKRDLSPVARGSFWNPWWLFKRFSWAKMEQVASDFKGTVEGMGHLTKMGKDKREDNMRPFDAGSGDSLGPPIDPPDVPGHEYNEYPDDERDAWEDANVPASEFGAAFPAGPRGSSRLAMQLLFGLAPTLTAIYFINVLLKTVEEGRSVWDEVNPLKAIKNMSEIAMLFWLKDSYTYMELSFKSYLWGLTTKEDKDKQMAGQRLQFTIPFIGRSMREKFFEQKEADAAARALARRLGLKLKMPRIKGLPAEPQGSRRNAVGQPGLLQRVFNSLRGRPSLPKTGEPPAGTTPAPGDGTTSADVLGQTDSPQQGPTATIPPPPG